MADSDPSAIASGYKCLTYTVYATDIHRPDPSTHANPRTHGPGREGNVTSNVTGNVICNVIGTWPIS